MADTEPESPGRRMSDFASNNNMSLTVMTFNLHRERATDGPNSWEHRKDLCASVINKFSPLIVCTQEGPLFLSPVPADGKSFSLLLFQKTVKLLICHSHFKHLGPEGFTVCVIFTA
ncbi:hypothetical protein Mapa_014065 [Marchantia paleacea]|nr:hypothetical protein Mapa_014065 [Marchantia paleacea]